MADRVVIMANGKVEQMGSPREIYRTPENRFVAEFVGSNNIVSGLVKGLEGGNASLETEVGVCWASIPTGVKVSEGDKMDLIVSADVISVSVEKPEADNVISCSLISEEFVGSFVTLFFETEKGIEVKALIHQRDVEKLNIRSRSNFFLSWSKESIHVLKR